MTTDASPTVTTLSRKWLVKWCIFALVLTLLGAWGWWDATVVYPGKGERHAEFMLKDYLNKLSMTGGILRDASVIDPASTLADLEVRRDLDADSIDIARRSWLLALSRINTLDEITQENNREMQRRANDPGSPYIETRTLFIDPVSLQRELNAELEHKPVPSPLNAYDIPFQWVLVVLGGVGALTIMLFMLRCRGQRFRYDPDTMELTLPSGKSFAPAQIQKVDKRDWHKYYIHLTIEGFKGELKLDLLRYTPLEEWVLEMEKHHPNYEPPEEETESSADEADSGLPQGVEPPPSID